MIQTKLTVNRPGDRYEREADQVAEAVMRMPLSEAPGLSSYPTGIQRACAACTGGHGLCPDCEAEEGLQRQTEEEEEEPLQAKEAPGRSPAVTPGLQARIQALRGGGRPLPSSERTFFEPRFGYDFSQVRIHTGVAAAKAARAVDARAFTLGSDVAFAPGQYSPQLLAHELTHVVQQGAASRSKPVRGATGGQAGVLQRSGPLVMTYRDKSKPYFNKADPIAGLPSPINQEREYKDDGDHPMISDITIDFKQLGCDADTGCAIPTGTVIAEYKSDAAFTKYKWKATVTPRPGRMIPVVRVIPGVGRISFPIAGGSVSLGLTDLGDNQDVCRIEGQGYVSGSLRAGITLAPDEEWTHKKRYLGIKGSDKPSFGNMDFAVFLQGKTQGGCVQAIHGGAIDEGSHSCVHAGIRSGSSYDPDLLAKLKRVNYHSEASKTKVHVRYDPTVLLDLCAHRYYNGDGRISANPCSTLGGTKSLVKKIKARYPDASKLPCPTCK